MNKSSGGTTSRIRLTDRDVWFYEDNGARMLHIMNEVRGITLDISDADVLEAVARRLASITEYAGQTRRSLIAHRDARQLGDGQNDGSEQ